MKDQKGITLVALIITIIVMLILVAVTISVALNGGLFDRARSANRLTKQSQIAEAAAMAKAELLARYYEGTTTADRRKPDKDDDVKALINEYLGKSDNPAASDLYVTTVTESNGVYTVTAVNGVEYLADKGETMPVIDLSNLTFASGS